MILQGQCCSLGMRLVALRTEAQVHIGSSSNEAGTRIRYIPAQVSDRIIDFQMKLRRSSGGQPGRVARVLCASRSGSGEVQR